MAARNRKASSSRKKKGVSARSGPKKASSTAKSRSKQRAPRKTSRKPRAARSSSRQSSKQTQAPPALIKGMSLDRKLDLIGVVLTLLGLLTLLSLISQSRSPLTSGILSFLRAAFGLGVFVLPIVLIGIGLWLILRHFEQVPHLAFERLVGLTFLYGNLLTTTHFLAFASDRESSLALAASGGGGGYLGAVLSEVLIALLGFGGTAVSLVAWMVVGLMLAMDMSLAELFHWTGPIWQRVRSWQALQVDKVSRLLGKRTVPAAGAPGAAPAGGPPAGQTGLMPGGETLHPSGTALQGAQGWMLPRVADILEVGSDIQYSDEIDRQRAQLIQETLTSFGAPSRVVEINRGPTITQFGVEPDFIETRYGRTRVRVNKIASLADDLALALAAERIRIQAPVPGKGFVGIEVPNEQVAMVSLRDVVESPVFQDQHQPLQFALGQDVAGNAVVANLAAMPHLLIAGATGSGKSVCVNAIISCLLMHNSPETMRFLMVDPKRVELTGYNGIPHLLSPVVVELERVVGALQWVTREMDSRYQKFHDTGTRNIADYNQRAGQLGQQKLPLLVVIIDELADLMMLAPDQTEKAITRLAQLARATGIHLVISTQRPSVDVVTGLIKANFPARVSFAVSSGVDSRVILDQPGAERLLGRGDMLFQAPDAPAPVRLQGVFVSDHEILRLVQYWRQQVVSAPDRTALHSGQPVDAPPAGIPLKQKPIWEELEEREDVDPLYQEAVALVRRQGRASVSMLQRRLRIGYTRSARLVETMEANGIVGPPEGGAQTRAILDYGPAAPPVDG